MSLPYLSARTEASSGAHSLTLDIKLTESPLYLCCFAHSARCGHAPTGRDDPAMRDARLGPRAPLVPRVRYHHHRHRGAPPAAPFNVKRALTMSELFTAFARDTLREVFCVGTPARTPRYRTSCCPSWVGRTVSRMRFGNALSIFRRAASNGRGGVSRARAKRRPSLVLDP
jgi:hypothetical protein